MRWWQSPFSLRAVLGGRSTRRRGASGPLRRSVAIKYVRRSLCPLYAMFGEYEPSAAEGSLVVKRCIVMIYVARRFLSISHMVCDTQYWRPIMGGRS